MKQSFLPGFALMLTFGTVIAFTGCDSAIGPAADTAALNTSRTVTTGASASGDLSAVTVSGPLAVVDGAYAVLYQGNPWFVKGLSRLVAPAELTEGVTVTVTGEASPILDKDPEGNSLFWGYYLKAETLSVNS
jgi:hypothetical protein